MVDVSEAQDRSLCQLQIFKNPLAFNVLGTPLFRGYYSIHDPVNNKIGFVPVAKSPKGVLEEGEPPTNELNAPLTQETEIWIYVITGVVAVGIALLLYYIVYPKLLNLLKNELIAIVITVLIMVVCIALFVWVVMPELEKAFGEQTTVDDIDPAQLPSVGASQETSVLPLLLTFGVVFFILKAIFTPKPVAAIAKPALAFD